MYLNKKYATPIVVLSILVIFILISIVAYKGFGHINGDYTIQSNNIFGGLYWKRLRLSVAVAFVGTVPNYWWWHKYAKPLIDAIED
ncbi:MAG: hypothetical protein AB8H12_23865 [Lewinella sp.]